MYTDPKYLKAPYPWVFTLIFIIVLFWYVFLLWELSDIHSYMMFESGTTLWSLGLGHLFLGLIVNIMGYRYRRYNYFYLGFGIMVTSSLLVTIWGLLFLLWEPIYVAGYDIGRADVGPILFAFNLMLHGSMYFWLSKRMWKNDSSIMAGLLGVLFFLGFVLTSTMGIVMWVSVIWTVFYALFLLMFGYIVYRVMEWAVGKNDRMWPEVSGTLLEMRDRP